MMPSLRFAGVVLLSLACLTGGPGCSLMFAKGPPKRPPALHQPVRCTTTYNLSILDGLIAALDVLLVVSMITSSDTGPESVRARTTGVALGISDAGLHAMSMAVGISRVGRCRELLDARARARQAEEADEEEEEDEDEEDVAGEAKPAGKAAPASQPTPEPPTVTPQAAPDP
jgi:hypothetical protein